jgi:hypothetical protein
MERLDPRNGGIPAYITHLERGSRLSVDPMAWRGTDHRAIAEINRHIAARGRILPVLMDLCDLHRSAIEADNHIPCYKSLDFNRAFHRVDQRALR